MYRIITNLKSRNILWPVLACLLILVQCKGPAGSEGPVGPQGPKGEAGAVGPAGDNGSVMYAGKGAPTGNVGKEGDYYLNNKTGELYGPKDGDGWGNPIIVLMGEDGQDGANGQNGSDGKDGKNGQDGKDGQDGSVIYAGTGVPAASLGKIGDFYLNKDNGNFYGPKTNKGWGTPTNLKGKDGKNGADGKDGQNGQDGSTIYAGTGAPATSVGVVGDFYLNKTNGNFYGPKTNKGWGTPTNLRGADGKDGVDGKNGQDGKDGRDGADGKDGSQIFAGHGTPNLKLGNTGDFYLDKSSYKLYGPKTSRGWESGISLKGADGNANVTRYIFPGHDFKDTQNQTLRISGLTEQEANQSAWLVYLVTDEGISGREWYFSLPGTLGMIDVTLYHFYLGSRIQFEIHGKSKGGYYCKRAEVIRIAASNTVDKTGINSSIVPEDLDITDYNTVAKYYGFGNDNSKILQRH